MSRRNKNHCWKCNSYIWSDDPRFAGLCSECRDSLLIVVMCIAGMIAYGWAFSIAHLALEGEVPSTGLFIFRVVFGLLGPLAAIIVGLLLYGLGKGAVWVSKFLYEWGEALYRLGKDTYEEQQERLEEEAKQRALEADARRLDGAALDALLTEEYKQKQGWR